MLEEVYSPLNVANWFRTNFIPRAKETMITAVDSDESKSMFLRVNFKVIPYHFQAMNQDQSLSHRDLQ